MPYTRSPAALTPANYWQPSDYGLLAANLQPEMATTGSVPATAGRLEFAKLPLTRPAVVTNICMTVNSVGATLTAGQCFAALYTEAGVLVGVTADQAAAWVSTGPKAMALASGPFSCPVGNYYVAFWYNGTTSPGWMRATPVATAHANLGTTAPTLRYGFANTGLTTTAPGTMGAQTANSVPWLVALS